MRDRWHWPNALDLKKVIPVGIAGAFVFCGLYGLASVLGESYSQKKSLNIFVDSWFPYWPYWAFVYLSINFLLPLSIFLFRSRVSMLRFIGMISAMTLTACVIFVAYPCEPPHIRLEEDFSLFMWISDCINLENNFFPSLHVAISISACVVYAKYSSRWIKFLLYLWSVLICLSTLFIHEHNLADVGGGVLLAVFGLYLFHYFPKESNSKRLSTDFLNYRGR